MNTIGSKVSNRAVDQDALAAPRVARWLTLGAVAGPLLFAAAWLVLGFMSPGYTLFGNHIAPYSPITQPISGLGLGPTAPFMNAAFMLSGLMLIIGVIGIHQTFRGSQRTRLRWTCTALLMLSPVGLIVDGIFTLEAVLPHLVGFLLGAASPVLSFLAMGFFLRGIPHWRRFGSALLLASPLTLSLVILFFLTFDPMASGSGLGFAGITQRALVIEMHAWFMALGWLAFKRSPSLA